MAGAVICFVIYALVALIMIGIGVSQLKSKTPVGFYSGEKPPAAQELSDVAMWNKKHGKMWMIYGGIILFSGLIKPNERKLMSCCEKAIYCLERNQT